ncbi:MAG: glycosyl transferase family 2, partial [Euryarchaeota archaeon]|nr:glycosyl transferase family 2 [Euryarchaeota archaeon]
VSEYGVDPDYATVADRYRSVAAGLVDQYAVDAAYNGLDYDRSDELDQVAAYSETVGEPGEDTRLPAWREAPIAPDAVAAAAAADLAAATADSVSQSESEPTDEPANRTTQQ